MLKLKTKTAIEELLRSKIKTREELMMVKRKIAKKYKLEVLRSNEILEIADEQIKAGKNLSALRLLLKKRSIRTMSGIAPVAVLTKPFPCPGKCVYCPTEKDVPQSYLSNEPAVMRAILCDYDPYKQVNFRLEALEKNGHNPNKIEIIVIGGTWSVLSPEYKYWYIANCFKAANEYGQKGINAKKESKKTLKLKIAELKKMLATEQKKNETAKYKIIGLTLETRPDYINDKELAEMRELGATRVELGVQAPDDKILELNKRGHNVAEIARATKLLRDYGFKITYHIMPGLPGATARKDIKMFKMLFNDERFQPDQIKFYPTVVTKGSLLYKWWQDGKYKPYSNKVLENLIIDCKASVPEYVRIIRLIRDIPAESIVAGNKITNLRQIMQARGAVCRCIRCREAREKKIVDYKIKIMDYPAGGGREYFIQAESRDEKILYGFCRLRLPSHIVIPGRVERGEGNPEKNKIKSLLNNSALVRELHIYGELVPIGNKKKVQHAGLGKLLMSEAEKISKKKSFKKIAVISGVGVRGYYRKMGYRQKDTYMVKGI